MNEQLHNLTQSLTKRSGATSSIVAQVMSLLGVTPPADYVEFLLESNGAEGFMSCGRYLMLQPAEQLVPCNEPYGLGSSGPGLVAFGSDGGMMLYAFDIRQSPLRIVEVDAISMENGPITLCGDTFVDFLEHLNGSMD